MTYLNAPDVVTKETLRAATSLGPTAERILDRWASGWPKATKALERSGRLLDALRSQAEREARIYGDARVGGENSHLADHEIAQLYGLEQGPPAP